jgi:hypothetical protein
MRSGEDFGQVSSREQAPFAELSSGLQRLREEDLHAVLASSLDDDMVELRRHINSCEAEFTRRLRRFDTGGGHVASGTFGAKQWLVGIPWSSWRAGSWTAVTCRRLAVSVRTWRSQSRSRP